MSDEQSDLHDWIDTHQAQFKYMAHFMTPKFLSQGHNDMSGEDDAAQVDKFLEGLGSSKMTEKAQDEPGGA